MSMSVRSKCVMLGITVALFVWSPSVTCAAKRTMKAGAIAINCDIPDDFGKTHFIVGYPEDQLEKHRAKKKEKIIAPSIDTADSINLVCDGCIKHVLFSPDDNIQKILLHLINAEKESVRLTAYSFTDGDVARALMDAHKRGVSVEIIADPACMLDRFGKVPMIKDQGIVVFVYDPDHLHNDKKSFTSSIMHHKFIIFGKNISGKSAVWTGSFNWTKSAHRRNQENVVILDDKDIVAKYEHQFELLKKRCKSIKPKKEVLAKRMKNIPVHIVLSKKGTLFENNEVRA